MLRVRYSLSAHLGLFVSINCKVKLQAYINFIIDVQPFFFCSRTDYNYCTFALGARTVPLGVEPEVR